MWFHRVEHRRGLTRDEPQLQRGDILSLNCFHDDLGLLPRAERTLFVGEVDDASMRVWQTNIDSHEFGMKLLRPGGFLCEITMKINEFLAERQSCIPDLRLWPLVRDPVALLWPRGCAGAAGGYRHVLEPGMVISIGADADDPRRDAGRGRLTASTTSSSDRDEPEDISTTLTRGVQRGCVRSGRGSPPANRSGPFDQTDQKHQDHRADVRDDRAAIGLPPTNEAEPAETRSCEKAPTMR